MHCNKEQLGKILNKKENHDVQMVIEDKIWLINSRLMRIVYVYSAFKNVVSILHSETNWTQHVQYATLAVKCLQKSRI